RFNWTCALPQSILSEALAAAVPVGRSSGNALRGVGRPFSAAAVRAGRPALCRSRAGQGSLNVSAWNNLVSAALVGTERQTSMESMRPVVGAELEPQIDTTDRANALLQYAAIGALTRLAGTRPAAAPPVELEA